MKLHVEYDYEVNAPIRIELSHANIDDCSVGQNWPIVSDTIYVFDKGYYDFNWWWSIENKGAFFVARLKIKHHAVVNVTYINIHYGESVLNEKEKSPLFW